MVSVESGIGWIPFMNETMDYELWENAPAQFKALKRKPSEYFKDHWHATYWFERAQGNAVQQLSPAAAAHSTLGRIAAPLQVHSTEIQF